MSSLGSVEQMRAANRRFVSSAVLIGALSTVTGLAMLGRESMTARLFGRSDDIEAFLVAVLIPMFLINAAGNSIGAGFVPTLLRVRHDAGQRAASDLIAAFMLVGGGLVLAAILLAALLFPFALPWLARGFAAPKRDLTLHLFYVFLPLVAIGALGKFWLAVLNGYERFVAGSLIPLAVPLAVIALLFFAPPGAALDFLLAGVGIGLALQLLLAFAATGQAQLPRLPKLLPHVKPLLANATRQYFSMLAGTLTLMLLEVVDTIFASMQPPGTVAAINYASKLSVLVLGFAGTALATSVVPHYARMRATGTLAEQRHFLRFGEMLSVGGGALLAVLLAALSTVVVTLVYSRGQFGAQDVVAVSKLNALYVMQAPVFLGGVLYGRLLLVEGHSRILFIGAVLSVGVAVVANLVLAPWMGGAGIPVAASLAYLASALWLRMRLLGVLRARSASVGVNA